MSPNRDDARGRLAGKTFWDAAHKDLAETHHRIYILLIILLIFVLLALAAYLLLDIARHSSLPPFGNGEPQGLFSDGCSFGIPHNETLSNATNPPETSGSPNETVSNEVMPSLNGTTSQGAMPALNGNVPQEMTAPLNSPLSKEIMPSLNCTTSQQMVLPLNSSLSQGLVPPLNGTARTVPISPLNGTIPQDLTLSLNSTPSKEMIPPPKTIAAPNISVKSVLPIALQNYAASLAARASSITDATVQVLRSLGSDVTRSGISGSSKALQEYLWQWPSSVNSWASPYLMPVLNSVRTSIREIGDGVKGFLLPRANLSLKLPSINAH
jgi:hypothetical protein